jgi:hypothetical protein
MSDNAKGPAAGYIFQFEKALLLLSMLENPSDYVSIEVADDVAVHDENSVVLISIQAKHSIASKGTTFENTSHALWRTFEIWIKKLEGGVFNKYTKFICSTNKLVSHSSLLFKITNSSFADSLKLIQEILVEQEEKLQRAIVSDPKGGNSIKSTIKLIKFAIAKKAFFETICGNLQIDDEKDVKSKLLQQLHLSAEDYNENFITRVYDEFYGWIVSNSRAKWLNGDEAKFTKKSFNEKHSQIIKNPAIINTIFRAKEILNKITEIEIIEKKGELFVKQIDDIKRRQDAKERLIQNAILDYIRSEIEIKHVISQGNYTEEDFKVFLEQCKLTWQNCFDRHVLKEIDEYDDTEKNDLAIVIFDAIMDNIDIKFKEGYSFTTGSSYVRNGSFLKLSNIPEIGWTPNWESKYKT